MHEKKLLVVSASHGLLWDIQHLQTAINVDHFLLDGGETLDGPENKVVEHEDVGEEERIKDFVGRVFSKDTEESTEGQNCNRD